MSLCGPAKTMTTTKPTPAVTTSDATAAKKVRNALMA
jgi:hypothetical protein